MNRVKDRLFKKEFLMPFILVTALFMFWGIPNNLNDILIRQFMKSFEITRLKAGLVQSAFYLGYFLLAMPAAMVMKKYSYKTGLVIGMFLFTLGTFLFWPAAIVGQYWFFLVALFVIACGLSFLETGANPFIAGLGSQASSERRLNFSQAFNPIGAVIGVLIGTLFIFSGIEPDPQEIEAMKAAGEYEAYLQSETMRVIRPYIILGTVIFIWAIIMIRTKSPKIEQEQKQDKEQKGSAKALFKYPHFLQGVLAQFFYVGAQVGTWSFFIQYVQDYTGLDEKTAGYFLTGTLAAFGLGRFSATIIMKYFDPNKLMGLYSIINVLLVLVGVIYPGTLGVWFIFMTSFFMSLMFPTIFAMSIKGLGPHTKIGGSWVVMAIIGGAIWTPVMGLISDRTGSMAMAMLVPLFCYIYVTYFSYIGSKPKGDLFLDDEPSVIVSH